jgi:hypothetical protein
MAFEVTEILDSTSDNVLAMALPQNNQVPVTVQGVKDHDIPVGKSFPAQISFDEILDWKVVSEFENAQSGIWQERDGIHLLRRIHSILDYGDGRIVLDVYMQNGPEFFTVHLDASEDTVLEADDGLEIVVKTLFIFPSA